jgi:hypothetical protein
MRHARVGLFSFLLGTAAMAQEAPQLKHLTVAPANSNRPVAMSALSIQRGANYPSVIELRGSVEIRTQVCLPVRKKGEMVCGKGIIVHADEALFHEDTGEIEAHGKVLVTPQTYIR